jgi:hypothetical protein
MTTVTMLKNNRAMIQGLEVITRPDLYSWVVDDLEYTRHDAKIGHAVLGDRNEICCIDDEQIYVESIDLEVEVGQFFRTNQSMFIVDRNGRLVENPVPNWLLHHPVVRNADGKEVRFQDILELLGYFGDRICWYESENEYDEEDGVHHYCLDGKRFDLKVGREYFTGRVIAKAVK